jgi:microsomal epoxide hydrolase
LHVKPVANKYKTVVPILIVHGWPGNVYEFYKLIPFLTDPQKHGLGSADIAFEVIAPSIPGYGCVLPNFLSFYCEIVLVGQKPLINPG